MLARVALLRAAGARAPLAPASLGLHSPLVPPPSASPVLRYARAMTAVAGEEKRKRGRPPKERPSDKGESAAKEAVASSSMTAVAGEEKRKRGRPPKERPSDKGESAAKEAVASSSMTAVAGEEKKKRGRPPKVEGKERETPAAPGSSTGKKGASQVAQEGQEDVAIREVVPRIYEGEARRRPGRRWWYQ
jgi:hypothetical protein